MSNKNKNKKKGDVVPMEDFVDAEVVQTEEESEVEEAIDTPMDEETPKPKNWKKVAFMVGGVLTGIGILAKTMYDQHQLNQYKALALLNGEAPETEEESDEDDDGDETEEE